MITYDKNESPRRLTIKDWPDDERPREKMILRGADALSDSELLAILIGSGVGSMTAVDIAKQMIIERGSLREVSQLSIAGLKRFKGIGKARAAIIAAAFELHRRAASGSSALITVHAPADLAAYLSPKLRDKKQELFIVIALNSANKILREIVVTTGLVNSSLTHPREVFREAIAENATSVIVAHNHPSGNPEPSAEDIAITKQLIEASRIIGIPLHDHIIIAGERYTSFAERGLM